MASVGHICLDVIPIFPQGIYDKLDEVIKPGKLLNMDGVTVHTGGSVANTGLALNLLGENVKLLAKVGNDPFGKMIINMLEEFGLGESMIIDDNVQTSYSVVLSPPGIDRIFLHDAGANNYFQLSDIDFDNFNDVDMLHFGYPTVMEKIYNNNGLELKELMRKAKSMNIATSMDMAAVEPKSKEGKLDWEKIIKDVIQYVDFFVPSAEELAFMIDKDIYNSWIEKSQGHDIIDIIDIKKDIVPLGNKLIEWGAKVVIIKCGSKGMYFQTAKKAVLENIGSKCGLDSEHWADRKIFEESFKPNKIVSATGAGDTSIAAFLTAVHRGYGFYDCLKLSCGTGAACVESYDSLSGILSLEELENRIKAGWAKQHIHIEDSRYNEEKCCWEL